MGSVVQWLMAALLAAPGVALGGDAQVVPSPARFAPVAALAAPALAQDATLDDEPLDGDIGEPPAAEQPAADADDEALDAPAAEDGAPDDEDLDAGAPPAADVEPLDQGLPPAAAPTPAPAAQPAPAPAPAPAAEPAPAPAATPAPKPTFYPEPIAAKPAYHYPAPVWPFDHGGVYVNAGFAPDAEFPFSSPFGTCGNQVRLGRAYVGVGCDGADVTVGHLPPPWETADEAFPAVALEAPDEPRPAPVVAAPLVVAEFFPAETESRPREAAATGSNRSRTPARVVRGESRTTTTTTVINRDGDEVVDMAQGADNETDVARGGGDNRSRNRQTSGQDAERQGTASERGGNGEDDARSPSRKRPAEREKSADSAQEAKKQGGKDDGKKQGRGKGNDKDKGKKKGKGSDKQERQEEKDERRAKQERQAVATASCDKSERNKGGAGSGSTSGEEGRDQSAKRDRTECGKNSNGRGNKSN